MSTPPSSTGIFDPEKTSLEDKPIGFDPGDGVKENEDSPKPELTYVF